MVVSITDEKVNFDDLDVLQKGADPEAISVEANGCRTKEEK